MADLDRTTILKWGCEFGLGLGLGSGLRLLFGLETRVRVRVKCIKSNDKCTSHRGSKIHFFVIKCTLFQ